MIIIFIALQRLEKKEGNLQDELRHRLSLVPQVHQDVAVSDTHRRHSPAPPPPISTTATKVPNIDAGKLIPMIYIILYSMRVWAIIFC